MRRCTDHPRIEYAIYQLARPFTTAVGAEFGGPRLPGYTATQEARR
jgi:hypothetical protein